MLLGQQQRQELHRPNTSFFNHTGKEVLQAESQVKSNLRSSRYSRM